MPVSMQHKRVRDPQFIPSSLGTLLDNAASTKTYIKGIVLYNANTTAETVLIYMVPASGGALGTATAVHVLISIQLNPLEKYIEDYPGDGIVLDTVHDSLQGSTTTASKVNMHLIGDYEA